VRVGLRDDIDFGRCGVTLYFCDGGEHCGIVEGWSLWRTRTRTRSGRVVNARACDARDGARHVVGTLCGQFARGATSTEGCGGRGPCGRDGTTHHRCGTSGGHGESESQTEEDVHSKCDKDLRRASATVLFVVSFDLLIQYGMFACVCDSTSWSELLRHGSCSQSFGADFIWMRVSEVEPIERLCVVLDVSFFVRV